MVVFAPLVHHVDASTKDAFSTWLHANTAVEVVVRRASGQEALGTMFRVRICFGRGLIVLKPEINARQHETLTVTFRQHVHVN